EPVFLAAIFHNNAKVFPAWSREMLRIIHYLGSENVFVSLVESYSKDETPQLLRSFDETLSKLHVRRKITAGDTSIPRPHNIISNQARIEFLAATRNLALEPLRTMKNFAHGRVLFSNDVFVTAEAVVDLLNMRAGDYDVACGMDFDDFGLYDVWVTRDRLGSLVASVWPFILEPSGRRSIEQNEPAEVFSCWNGITVLPAEPFLLPAHRDNATSKLSPQPLYPPLAHTHPAFETAIPPRLAPALRFRTSGPKECFSSESFLISYDLRRQFGLDKFFVNPRVVVAYHRRFFFWNNHVLRHWIVKWWMRNVERGRYLHRARITLSNLGPEGITLWDGGACHGSA
ncbi:cryptococcal mannosyltransferase 1-domain-containing protein, partial [Auriculariales sp. MPI-PUGE-AT-0066]